MKTLDYTRTGSGPLLVYIPGMEGTGRTFFRQEAILSPQYTVAILRLRKDPPFSYDDLVEDVRTLVELESAEQVIVVGESFGGTVALQFALRYQERIKHLVLVNTFPYFPRRFRLNLGSILLPLAFRKFTRTCWTAITRQLLKREMLDETGMTKLIECSFSQGLTTSRARWDLIQQLDLRSRLADIRIPVTIVASEKDRVVPLQASKFMADRIPQARLIVLPKLGHTCLITNQFSLLSVL